MGGTVRSGSHLPEKSDCRIRQFARTVYEYALVTYILFILHMQQRFWLA